MEELWLVKAVSNEDNMTTFRILTSSNTYYWKLPYKKKIEIKPAGKNTYGYIYSKSIMDLCKENKIDCTEYFDLYSKDTY